MAALEAIDLDPVTSYALDITEGRILAGPLVRLACRRHLLDLERSDLIWDPEAAARVVRYFASVLRLDENQPFILLPFQVFYVGNLYGWKTLEGVRRYQTAYIELGKGNGKSPVAGGLGILMTTADGEPRAECYAAATKKEQAMILFSDAVAMAKQSPRLAKILKFSGGEPNVWSMAYLKEKAFFRAIASDDAQSGRRVHFAALDEIHEAKSPTVINMMRAGTKRRRQPLIFEITNSGFDRTSICWQHHEYSRKVLESAVQGGREGDKWFAYISGLDPADENAECICGKSSSWDRTVTCPACGDIPAEIDGKPQDAMEWLRDHEEVWVKANPGLDDILPREYIRNRINEAIGMPVLQNEVLRLNFNQWTEGSVAWINMTLWAKCDFGKIDESQHHGRVGFGGLDLSETLDLTAAVVYLPIQALPKIDEDAVEIEEEAEEEASSEDEPSVLLAYFWMPSDCVGEAMRRDRVPYDLWIREGWIRTTPGNVVDYEYVKRDILAIAERFQILQWGYDPYNATQLVIQLGQEGLTMVPVRQGFLTLNAPSKMFMRLIKSRRFNHGGNPVLRWMASNAVAEVDPAGNVKPSKAKSTAHIDGISASVTALDRALRSGGDQGSVYESRGIMVL